MAIGTPSASPAVTVKEIDLSGVVPNNSTSTGAFVGTFRWGPVEEVTNVNNEVSLVGIFGAPDDAHTVNFHSAAQFLRYSDSLKVVRAISTDAVNAGYVEGGSAGALVKNDGDFDAQLNALDSDAYVFIAAYPGDIGNSLTVEMCPAGTPSDFTNWSYVNEFDVGPGTSSFAANLSASNDEVHVVVVDTLGTFGQAGAVIEKFAHVSLGSNAKNEDGSSNYVKDVINRASSYVRMVGFETAYTSAGAGSNITTGTGSMATAGVDIYALTNGSNGTAIDNGEIATGWALFNDTDNQQIDFMIAPEGINRAESTAIVNNMVSIAGSTRKDCVVVASPARTDIVGLSNTATITTNIIATADTFTYSSYLFVDGNYVKVYDKYNDKYINIPAASSTAGIMAASDYVSAPWFSPAGGRRGSYLGITSVLFSPDKSQRDDLYKASVNPVSNIPGQGVLLYGDKTHLNRPSAFDRINVRRLFLTVERNISAAAKNVLFELNDEFTRAEFVNIVEPYLREIQGRRGLTDFRVVCDETNNTSAVIDRNEFVASIFMKPSRSINYVTLNFVAVRTGVSFEEIVGTV